ncbi:MAG: hypothetical protein Q8Q09_14455 [Deltaproteobacteria bacterium]|nr:hypothetical protein [Deltaproteobacteria bacterium]
MGDFKNDFGSHLWSLLDSTYDAAFNSWSWNLVDSAAPTEVELTATDNNRVRLTYSEWSTGRRRTRGVTTFNNAIVPSTASYLWTTTHTLGGTTSSAWRNQLGVAIGINQSQRAVYRVMDQSFPVL